MAAPSFNIWLQAARPRTLTAAVSPVLLGTAIAAGDSQFHFLAALAALAGALLIQIGTNFANDYFDFFKGADNADRVGPTRVTQAGLVTPGQMRLAMGVVFGTAFLIGIYLVARAGWPVVAMGLVSLLLAVAYTGGPFPLAYNGLGDIPAFLFFGPLASWVTYYVQALEWSDLSFLVGCSAGFFAVAFLSINNLRDIDEDRAAGKHTLIALLGVRFGQWQYITSLTLATLLPVLLVFLEPQRPFVLLAALTFLMSWFAFGRTLHYRDPQALIPILGMTGKLQIIFTVLFCIGWFIGVG